MGKYYSDGKICLRRHNHAMMWRRRLLMRNGSQGAAAAGAVEKTAFDVKLEKFDATSKLKVIKEVRSFTDLGLKEAKDLVEKVPIVVNKGAIKEEAERIAAKLKEISATVVLE